MKTPIDMAIEAENITRWSMIGTDTVNTVAAHSFNVAILSMAIRKAMFNTNHISAAELCYCAMLHDIKEVYTGDIPTPTKEKMRSMGFDLDAAAEVHAEELPIPESMKPIIKMADLMDNYLWIRVHGVGARAHEVMCSLRDKLMAAIAEAGPDLGPAAAEVLDYVINRRSGEDDQRKRFAEDRARLVSAKA